MIDVITYHAVNCPYCKEMELGAILANSALPLGRKIILMDYHSSERWNDFLDLKKIKGGRFVPQALIMKDDLNFLGKPIKKGIVQVISTFDFVHFKTLVKRLEGLW